MILSIASGKGGTGKTTVATNLALSLDNVQLIDCDVEEPNANIFLNTTIIHIEDVYVTIPDIDKTVCNFCGQCSQFCRFNALAVVKSKILFFPELCHGCGGCELVCPMGAVGWNERVVGRIEYGDIDGIDFSHGLLNVGEVQAIPVIKALTKKINKNKNVILDAPPGTSCPVIETVGCSDYCILVTEPTPFGLHDFKLAVDVVRHLNLPFGIIINRDGVGDNKVEIYCQQERIPVLMRIPHNEEIARLYSNGIPFVKKIPGWRERFIELFNTVQNEVGK